MIFVQKHGSFKISNPKIPNLENLVHAISHLVANIASSSRLGIFRLGIPISSIFHLFKNLLQRNNSEKILKGSRVSG